MLSNVFLKVNYIILVTLVKASVFFAFLVKFALYARMLVTAHFLVGAALGIVSRSPKKAFPIGFASHFVLDAIPHWGVSSTRKGYLRVAAIDGISIVCLSVASLKFLPDDVKYPAFAGGLGAVFPDFDKPSVLFFNKDPFPNVMGKFHRSIQTESLNLFWVDILTAAVAGIAVYKLSQTTV